MQAQAKISNTAFHLGIYCLPKYLFIGIGPCLVCEKYLTLSLLAATQVCRLLITCAKSLDPDQDRQNVECRSLSVSKHEPFDTLIVFLKYFFFEKG